MRLISGLLGVMLAMPLLASAEEIGDPVFIDDKAEYRLNGKEKSVCLAIRDETFTGIITAADGEIFFNKNSRDDFEHSALTVVYSHNFLKIGRKNIQMQLYTKTEAYWLLTEVEPGTGIKCKMLEKLTICK